MINLITKKETRERLTLEKKKTIDTQRPLEKRIAGITGAAQ